MAIFCTGKKWEELFFTYSSVWIASAFISDEKNFIVIPRLMCVNDAFIRPYSVSQLSFRNHCRYL